ncbi:hypothetical protein RN001_013385 [Aquatica leii]|uniref:Protein sleepless n=1 Tax=Aquatica leii TaxID=1421715 RepID=A0AAN7PZU5_9COLE|nr:hypothetical protein RN001_013385 [Aquatica leii]
MASRYYQRLLVVLLVLISIQLSSSIKCFSCTSNTEPGCSDLFNNITIPASYCDLSTSVCVKQVLPALGSIRESTFRGCVSEEYCKLFSTKSKHCSSCKEDYCNSAVTSIPSISLLALPISYYFFSMFKE